MFINNAWYVAATSKEIEEKPLARTICGRNMVFFRGDNNQVFALDDFCPHRGAPLSLGYVEKGNIVCGYHGLQLDSDGKPASMPGQSVGRFPCVHRFPVIERYGFIWVWPGEESLADAEKIPAFEWAENDGWAYGGGLYHIQCDYRLMIDNLMDLTHETYVHSTSIGQKEIDEAPVDTSVSGETVITSRYMENITAPPFWKMAMRANDMDDEAVVDRWQICRFSPPSHVMIDVGVALSGQGGIDAAPEHKANSTVVDFITPETETSMWYFWGMARQFKPDDAELTHSICEGQGKIFAEDLEMLERQQRNLLQYPQRRLMTLNIDAGGAHARRVIAKLLKAEASTE